MSTPRLLLNLGFVVLLAAAVLPVRTTPPVGGFDVAPFLQSQTPTSIWIGWETTGQLGASVDYGTTPALGSTVSGFSVSGAGGSLIHHAQLTGLTPDTLYWYQATSGSLTSTLATFRTPAALTAEAPFTFAAYSDTQVDGGNPTKHQEIVDLGILDFVTTEYGVPIEEALDFVLCVGDLVSTGSNHSHWKNHFFGQADDLYRRVPILPTLGNHEADAALYFKYFELPQNGTPGYEEHWYYVDHGNVRIITIDTNTGYTIPAQLNWLDGVLADACDEDRIDFVFAQLHHPHKSELWTPGESSFSSSVVSRLEQFSTDCGKPSIHFFGHTHGYSRGQSRDHTHLMVNVATGMGNIDYWYEYPQEDYDEYQISLPDWGFVVMDVEAGADPSFRLRRVSRGNEVLPRDNEVMDDIVVRRFNDGPDTPQALFPAPSSGPVPGWDVPLEGSPFLDTDGDLALESHWQVSTTSGDYSAPIAESWKRRENWYRPPNGDSWYSVNTVSDPDITRTVLETSLPACGPVYWRVRYRDDGLAWSDWSAEQEFLVGESDVGTNAPVPADGAVAQPRELTLEWFPCTPADSYDVYAGTSPSLGPGAFRTNQTATALTTPRLLPLTTYYWRIDSRIGSDVQVGNTWSFTTAPHYPTTATAEWRFEDLAAASSVPLEATHGTSTMIPSGMTKGTDWDLGVTGDGVVPHIEGKEAGYIWLDNVFGANRGLETFFDAPGNGGGGCCDVHEFTIVTDLYFDPTETDLQAIWQGNATNSNDAEMFVNCGTGGFYVNGTGYIGSGLWSTGQWVRIAHRVDYPDSSAIFVNGVKVLDDTQLVAPDWVYGAGSGLPVWALSDNGGATDVARVYCANYAMVDSLMSDAEIAALAGPNAAGVFAALSGDTDSISLADGGRQELTLNGGPDHGGKLYFLLGSLSGTSPGLQVGAYTLPLNFDAYFSFTLQNPNTPPLASSLGFLDPWGAGAAAYALPPGLTGLAGLTLHHAYVLLEADGTVALTSNPVSLDLVD